MKSPATTNGRRSHILPTGEVIPIDNFDWMTPWLARGAQPDDEGFRALERAGVTHIVNLRLRDESEDVMRVTRRAKPVRYPVKNDFAPTEEQALRWLDFCAGIGENEKVYVHCHAGHGRTSTFCILVQLAQGEDLERAIEQERTYGFDPDNKHKRQAEFLRAFAARMREGAIEIPELKRSSTEK